MKTHLLVVPSKKTEEINWIKPLNNYLLSIYGNTSAYQNDINAFDKLRQDTRGVNADNTGLRLYYKYYSQLEILDLKIQFAALNKSKKLQFVWYDAFEPDVMHEQNALPFEKANVLFNVAALLTKFASSKYNESQSSGKSGSGSVKESILMLQQASGVYEFVNENFLHAPSNDLAQSTIRFLGKLSLAQAQEVFTLNVVTNDLNQSKNSLIAKLCKATSLLFEECFDMIGSGERPSAMYEIDYEGDFLEGPDDGEGGGAEGGEPSRFVAARLDPNWVSVIQFKIQYYRSLAFYFHALHLESTKKYGEAISYLNQSKEILDNAQPNVKSYELVDNYKYQKDVVGIKLNDLNKDNDLIYHDLVRANVNIESLTPMQVAKAIPLNQIAMLKEVNETDFGNFLSNVVPINIHELSSFYSEEKSQLLRNEIDFYEVSNEEAVSFLESLKLPKALYVIKESLAQSDDEQVPVETSAKVSEISRSFGEDQQLERENATLRKNIYNLIAQLNQYENQDQAIQLKKALYEASNSDSKLASFIDKHLYQTLSKGPTSEQVLALFKAPSSHEVSLLDMDDSQEKQVGVIETFLSDLNSIRSHKKELIDNLKKKVHADDISDILIFNSRQKSNNEIKSVIFPAELQKFQPFIDKLDNLISREKLVLSDLKIEWGKLLADPQVRKIQANVSSKGVMRQESIARIDDFYKNWKSYHAGLKKGNSWYNNIHQHCLSLVNGGADQLSGSMGRMQIGSNPQAPARNYPNAPSVPSGYGVSPQHSGQQQQQQLPPPQQQPGYGFSQPPFVSRGSSQDYSRPAPQLPPKHAAAPNFNLPQPPIKSEAAPPNAQNPAWSGKKNESGSGLIYDQPSTYDPRMYDFFSK
ncbi:uncharacterized protein LODBEIA_P22010 [Lodderomyces beijingensis]|uniref:BRO domain-containing protein 1 n=1 Tax=Lodderomyces beijingensis TaxID=1775926 RepID=A0ABP0ZIK3_9ASCO